MVTSNTTHTFTSQLQLSTDPEQNTILSVHRDTPLGEVLQRIQGQHYVLATDQAGHITGIVSTAQIRERLDSPNPFERRRWQQMPLSALLNVAFTPENTTPTVALSERLNCVSISENNRLFGMAVEDDIFLSWRCLESLLSVALSDPLTGLLNRLAYERRLHEEWNRAIRTGMSVGVVIVDLDNFKRINDTLGHPAGDAVLRGVGQQLESAMRSYDMVGRFGGDEFVVLCLGCGEGDIDIPVERIQQSIANMDIHFEECLIPITASIGAAVRHDGFESSDPRKLFSAADECLYHAKASPESIWKVELGHGCSGTPEPVQFRSGASPTHVPAIRR